VLCQLLVDFAYWSNIHFYALGYCVGAFLGTRVSKLNANNAARLLNACGVIVPNNAGKYRDVLMCVAEQPRCMPSKRQDLLVL